MVPKGFSMEYQRKPAVAAAASNRRRTMVRKAFNSGWFLGDGGLSQIFAQNDHGGNRVDSVFAVRGTGRFSATEVSLRVGYAAAEFFFEDAFGFPTGEAFIDEFDGEVELLAKALGETRGLVGHFTG